MNIINAPSRFKKSPQDCVASMQITYTLAKGRDSFSLSTNGLGLKPKQLRFSSKNKQTSSERFNAAVERANQLIEEARNNNQPGDCYVYIPKDMETCIAERKTQPRRQANSGTRKNSHSDNLIRLFGDLPRFNAAMRAVANSKGKDKLSDGILLLRSIASAINAVASELEIKHAEEQAERQQRLKRAEEIRLLMEKDGITFDDLKEAKLKAPVTPKKQYQCIVEGQVINYNGHGQVPTPMRDYLAQNKLNLNQIAL